MGATPRGELSAASSPFESSFVASVASESSEVKLSSSQIVGDAGFADEMVCKVCFDVVGCGPRLTQCAHLFCGDCIATWFRTHPGNQTWAQRAHSKGCVPCPVCKEPLQEDRDLFPVNEGGQGGSAFLWSMLQQMKVRCANHKACRADGACTWVGDYGSYQEHIRNCSNLPLEVDIGDPKGAVAQSEQVKQSQDMSGDESTVLGDGAASDDLASCSGDDASCEGDIDVKHEQATLKTDATKLLSSISAHLDSKLMAAEPPNTSFIGDNVESNVGEAAAEKEHIIANAAVSPPMDAAERPALQQRRSKKTKQQKRKETQPLPTAMDPKRMLDQQVKDYSQHVAQWQRAQALHYAYAAQWQAAQLQTAYMQRYQGMCAVQAAVAQGVAKR